MQPSNQPRNNQLGDDPRNLLILSCHGSNVGSVPVATKFDAAVATIKKAELSPRERSECERTLAGIFQNYVESGNWKELETVPFDRGLEGSGVYNRLEVALGVSELLTFARVSTREETFREQIAFACVKEIFGSPLQVSDQAVHQMHVYIKNAPAFIDRIVAFERAQVRKVEKCDLSATDIRFVYRADEVAIANLKLLIENNMPAAEAMKITEILIAIKKQSMRDEVIDLWKWFAHSSMCSSLSDENRLPEPVGRAALLGAVKETERPTRRFDLQGPLVVHQLPVLLPSNPAHWSYFGQRLTALAAIKDQDTRDLRIGAYVVSFREFVASRPFFAKEEEFFRQVNLQGVPSAAMTQFYRDVYGVDNGPGPEGSEVAAQALRETERAFRIMAAARYGLNIRKGYTRTIRETGKWLLEHMAEELKGESSRYRYGNIDAYPGPGLRLWDLDIRNALDLSTSESRRRHLKASPWIAASLRAGNDAEYHFTRGFKAIARTMNAALRPPSRIWSEKGSYNGEPYSALIFNDHFHNDVLPEVRMWLVPERVLHRKLVWAIENNVDINRLDLTPEGLAEEADALNLTIFNVGTSCVRWGSFANAWPHGTGPAHDWERDSEWTYSHWQSPWHIHRALVSNRYSEHLTKKVGLAMVAARVEHDKIKHLVNFFLDLHSSFLTMEESWAKGYANAEEAPAREEAPSEQDMDGGGGPSEDGAEKEADGQFDFVARRPRTRLLEHFLDLRNQIVTSRSDVTIKDIPSLEVQYTRLFARQAETPYISGTDMMLVFPDGKKVSLLPGKAKAGTLVTRVVEMDERMEALWDDHIVSRFAPNNCPRIILP